MARGEEVKVFDVRELCRALRHSIQEQPNGAANPVLELLDGQEDILDAVAAELDIEQRKEDDKAREGGSSRERHT